MQIARLAAERGVALSNADGTGITDEATLRVSLEAVTNVMNEIMQGLTAVDLRAAYANAIIAHPAGILGGVDQLNTGRVERVDTKALHLFLNEGIIPLIPPMGYDGEGRTFRVNSDAVALEVAEAMQAIKILFLSSHDGVVVDGNLIGQLSIAEAEEFVKKKRGTMDPGLISKLDHAARACKSRVDRVHLLNGLKDEALLSEIFSQRGIGTMVYSSEYQEIRRAFKKDVRGIMTLIRQSVDSEELVKRTRADILTRLEDYWVLEIDRNLVGCVALHVYPEQGIAELACLYVNKSYEGQGYGRKLMAYAEQLAVEKGIKQVIALSTQTFNYFQQKGGYTEVTPDVLPPDRRKKYDASARNSKVMIKTVTVATAIEASRA
jgi:amino-acid N-acetyltransferase